MEWRKESTGVKWGKQGVEKREEERRKEKESRAEKGGEERREVIPHHTQSRPYGSKVWTTSGR